MSSEENYQDEDERFSRSNFSKCSDCVIILGILALAILSALNESVLETNDIYIPHLDDLDNDNFLYPNVTDTVSAIELLIIVYVPWYMLYLFNLLFLSIFDKQFSFYRWFKYFYLMNRTLWFNLGTTLLITNLIKSFVGSPRPYFLSIYSKLVNDTLTQSEIDNDDANQIRLSFISGHASLSTASLILMTLMLYESYKYVQTMYYDGREIKVTSSNNPYNYYFCFLWNSFKQIPLLSILIVFIPTLIALYVSLTRIIDYKHFAVDVVGGMLVGSFCAYLSFSIYWNETYYVFNKYEAKKKANLMDETNVISV